MVGLGKGGQKAGHELSDAAVGMGLPDSPDLSLWIAQGGGAQGGLDFGRMMSVIVDHDDITARPPYVKTAGRVHKAGQRLGRSVKGKAARVSHNQRRQGIQDIMVAGRGQFHFAKLDAMPQNGKKGLAFGMPKIDRPPIGLSVGEAITNCPPSAPQAQGPLVIRADHQRSRRRQQIDEFRVGANDLSHRLEEIGVVVFHVGDDGDVGTQAMKHIVIFIGFNDERRAAADGGILAGAAHLAADNEAGVFAGLLEDMNDHRCRGGFAMRAGDGDAVLAAHDGGDDVLTLINGDALRQRRLRFDMVRRDGR